MLPVGSYPSCTSCILTLLRVHANHLHDHLSNVVSLCLTLASLTNVEWEGKTKSNCNEQSTHQHGRIAGRIAVENVAGLMLNLDMSRNRVSTVGHVSGKRVDRVDGED